MGETHWHQRKLNWHKVEVITESQNFLFFKWNVPLSAFVTLVKDLVFFLVYKKKKKKKKYSHFTFRVSLEACENEWTVCFVSKCLRFSSRVSLVPSRAPWDQAHSVLKECRPCYPSDCWPHATSEPAGIWTIIWFLILATFNSFLQMASTVGKIG